MTDDLAIPQVPEAAPDDPEDVSWALSTAEAMWARGDHSEGIKWVRRAAEAASEAENDTRALELAKAAADLAGLIARMSKAAFGDEGAAAGPPPVPMTRPRSAPPSRGASSSPPAIPQGPSSVTKVVATPSRAASIPLPSKASQPPPPLPGKSVPRTAMRPQVPAAPPSEPITKTKSSPVTAKSTISNRPPPESQRKGRRKSRENLEGAARTAGLLDSGPLPGTATGAGSSPRSVPIPAPSSGRLPNDTTEIAAARSGSDRSRRQEADATVVANVKDIMRPRTASRSTDEWDASPTQNLTGDDLTEEPPAHVAHAAQVDRVTRVGRVGGAPEDVGSARPSVKASPAASATPRSVRPPAPKHDPGIVTSQAVRVVVWRDASGVHVAPAGTVVSAITVDAVLVALEEGADLTAWLSQRG